MAGNVEQGGSKQQSKGLAERFKDLKNIELKGGLLFSAVSAFVAPALVIPGLLFTAGEYGQLKLAEAWENRKKNIPKSGVVYQAA